MKKHPHRLLIAALAAFCCVTASYAAQISGGISLAGGYTTDTGNLNTANAFNTFGMVQVTNASMDFVGVTLGTPGSVTMTPFTFDPFPGGGVVPLWSTVAGKTISFDLLSLSPIEQPGDDTLTLKGSGLFHMTGFDDTVGTFLFTANQAAGTFSFSLSQAATPTPDGGMTAVLLGFSLLGLGYASKRLRK